MRKFKSVEDIVIFGKNILEKDSIIKVSDDTEVFLEKEGISISLTLDQIISDKRFEEVNENDMKFDIKIITEEEEEEVKNYRIQLDVNTTRKKLREVEDYLRRTLEKML